MSLRGVQHLKPLHSKLFLGAVQQCCQRPEDVVTVTVFSWSWPRGEDSVNPAYRQAAAAR
jgi:hypothetical protein